MTFYHGLASSNLGGEYPSSIFTFGIGFFFNILTQRETALMNCYLEEFHSISRKKNVWKIYQLRFLAMRIYENECGRQATVLNIKRLIFDSPSKPKQNSKHFVFDCVTIKCLLHFYKSKSKLRIKIEPTTLQ